MSIGPLGAVAGVAGSSLAQAKGADLERAHGDVGTQRRRVYHEGKAASAAGVGEPDGEDHETADRSVDGRRPWEESPRAEGNVTKRGALPAKDPSHERGNLLDFSG
jgi:hypothetical protein